jgi:hypothetical protein
MKHKEPENRVVPGIIAMGRAVVEETGAIARFQTGATGIALEKPGSSNSTGGLRIGQKLS